jgi:hypothetical protein
MSGPSYIAPCQTFTLFATPPSLWTLETASGSSPAVPANEPFQPLVMRVTDGSSTDNPVMGVTLTFATTLTRPSPNPGGQSILLSSLSPRIRRQDKVPHLSGQPLKRQVMQSVRILRHSKVERRRNR